MTAPGTQEEESPESMGKTASSAVGSGGAHFVVGIERRQHSQLSGFFACVNSLSGMSELSIAGA
jgi:hypothetical protein